MRKVEFIEVPSLVSARNRRDSSETIKYNFNPTLKTLAYFKDKKFFIRTYGCQANIRDEEVMSGILTKLGMVKVYDEKLADVAILNTCAVRENAEDKVYGQIGDFKPIKAKNKNLILMICGCMIEQKHIIDKILDKFPFVDIMFGTTQNLLNTFVNKPIELCDEINMLSITWAARNATNPVVMVLLFKWKRPNTTATPMKKTKILFPCSVK